MHNCYKSVKNKSREMAKYCQITGKKLMTGNHVSHSNRKENRTFQPNLFKKRFYVPEDDKWVNLIISAKGMRIIDKKGIKTALKEAQKKGYIKTY